MLRMYSIMQLGHLWAKQPNTTSDSFLTDDEIDDDDDDDDGDDSILEVHPVAVETTDIQEREEEPMATGYQARNKSGHRLFQYTKNTVTREQNQPSSSALAPTASSSSLALSTSSDPGTSSKNLKNHPNMATFVHEEHQEDDDDDNYDDDDDDDDPIMKNGYYYYQPSISQQHHYNHYQRMHFNRPALHHLQIHPPYLDDLPPLTYDLTCITEENQSELNNSSMISSTGSLPKTPTSTVSTPLRRKRPEIKFNERRKNFAKKLKRVFTSKKKPKT